MLNQICTGVALISKQVKNVSAGIEHALVFTGKYDGNLNMSDSFSVTVEAMNIFSAPKSIKRKDRNETLRRPRLDYRSSIESSRTEHRTVSAFVSACTL